MSLNLNSNIGKYIDNFKQIINLKIEYYKIKIDQIDKSFTKPYDISFILMNSK